MAIALIVVSLSLWLIASSSNEEGSGRTTATTSSAQPLLQGKPHGDDEPGSREELLLVEPSGDSSVRTAVQGIEPHEPIVAEDHSACEWDIIKLKNTVCELEGRNGELLERIRLLELDAERDRYSQETPYGLFLASDEASRMTQAERDNVRYSLQEFPVFLQPGEATWIVDCLSRVGDWKQVMADLGVTDWDAALVKFLGPERLKAELPSVELERLKSEREPQDWIALFGEG